MLLEGLRFSALSLYLIAWIEMNSEDFDRQAKLVAETPKEKIGRRLKSKVEVVENLNVSYTIYEAGMALRLICVAEVEGKEGFAPKQSRDMLLHIEKTACQFIMEFLKANLNGPVWIYTYPVWHLRKTKPDYEFIDEVLPKYSSDIDELLNIPLDYPVEVTTPEPYTEAILQNYEVYDIETGRESYYIVLRGLTAVIGGSVNNVLWLARFVLYQIEPRPFVYFGKHIPKVALSEPWKLHKIHLVSAKGWLGDMTRIEDALERRKLLGYFAESRKNVKFDILLTFSGILIAITRAFEAVKPSVLWLPLTLVFLLCAIMIGVSKSVRVEHPTPSKILRNLSEPLFYIAFAVFILNALIDLDSLFERLVEILSFLKST